MKISTLKSTLCSLMAIAILALFLLNPIATFATNYYVSNAGSDTNNGKSQNAPFKTLAKVNSLTLNPGDIISLKGNHIFSSANGTVGIKIRKSGTANERIVINSYGDGRAKINSSSTFGVLIEDVSFITVKNLILVGEYVGLASGVSVVSNTNVGVLVKSKLKDCDNVIIENVEASKFKWSGIRFDSDNAAYAVKNSIIRDCKAHHNGDMGIGTGKVQGGSGRSKNIVIKNCTTHDNYGWNEIPTGSGIHISSSDKITVEHCVSYNNGQYNSSDAGGTGIWASSSKNVVFQFNESYSNKTGKADGGGFDIDGGVENALVQYNYSHDNYGAGYLVFQSPKGGLLKNVTIRYNISENDGHFINANGNIHAAFEVTRVSAAQNNLEDVYIYNNTAYTNEAYANVLKVSKNVNGQKEIKNVNFYNNLLIRPNTANVYKYDGNVIRANNHIDTQYNTSNSVVQNPGQGGTLLPNNQLINLDAYKLKSNSAVVNAGLNLQNEFGFNVGTRDFYNNSIPKNGAFDIGAHESVGSNPSPPCEEKLSNHNFEPANAQNISDWTTHKGGTAAATSDINQSGVAHVNITNGGNFDYNVQLWQDGLAVKANTLYRIKTNIRADVARTVRLIVRPVVMPNGGSAYFEKTINLEPSFNEFEFQFVSPATESNTRLTFLMGGNDKDVYLYDVSFKEDCTVCETEEILTQNTFDQNNANPIPGWTAFEGNGASMNSSINEWGVAQFNIANGAANNYKLQFWQDGISIDDNSNYTIKIRMRAGNNRTVRLIVRPVEFPNNEPFYYLENDFNLTSDFTEYTFNFPSNRSTANSRLSFLIGGDNVDVFIDRVSLTKVCNNQVKAFATGDLKRDLAKIYPNPVSDHLHVVLYEDIKDAAVSILDLTGRTLLTQNISHSGKSSVDLSKLVSGSYFIRVQSENGVHTQKILKY